MLDDQFFSIDEFNRETLESEKEAERKERQGSVDEDDEDRDFDDDVDLFKGESLALQALPRILTFLACSDRRPAGR